MTIAGHETITAGVIGLRPTPADGSISVVVPLYNEVTNVRPLVVRLRRALGQLPHRCEIVLVDDGSRDGTWEAVVELAICGSGDAASAGHLPVIGCRLSRNFGHQAALLAGLGTARGDAVVTMDGDLQHPPELIPEMVTLWRAGFDIVATQRDDTTRTSAFKRLTSRYFYRLFSALSEVELNEGSSDFRLVDRRVLREIISMRDSSLFLRGTVEWVGFNRTSISYQVGERFSGESKYSLLRMLKFAGSAIVSHSTVPLRVGVWIGLITSLLAVLEIAYAIGMTYSGRTVPGWASILIIQSFFFSILFILMGITGVYLAGIYRMLQARPNFIVSDTVALPRAATPGPDAQRVRGNGLA